MKKIFVLFATVLLLIGCGNKRGELVGVKQKKWFPEKPYGMTLVEGGAYIMGKADDDMAHCRMRKPKQLLFVPFIWMKQKLQIVNTDNLFIGYEIQLL